MQTAAAIIKVVAGVALVIFRISLYANKYPLQSSADIIMINIIFLMVGISLIAIGSFSLLFDNQRETSDAKALNLGAYDLSEAFEGNLVARAITSQTGKVVFVGLVLALTTVVTVLEIHSSEEENEKRRVSKEAALRPFLEKQKKIEELKSKLGSDDYSPRREAIVELLREGKNENWQAPGPGPQSEAEEILKKDPRSVEALISILKSDKDISLRLDVVLALGVIYESWDFPPKPSKNPRAVDALLTALKGDPDKSVRVNALKALEKIKDPRGLEIAATSEQVREERRDREEEKRFQEKKERATAGMCTCVDKKTSRVLWKRKVSSKEECERLCPDFTKPPWVSSPDLTRPPR